MVALLAGFSAMLAGCQGRETAALGESRAAEEPAPAVDEEQPRATQAAPAFDAGMPPPQRGPLPPPSPEETRSRVEASIRKLDDQLMAQPESPEWASRTEAQIAGVLSASSLQKEGLVVPSGLETQCRMTLCRIGVDFPQGVDFEPTIQALMFGIGEGLPNAETFQLTNPDGSVSFLIYART